MVDCKGLVDFVPFTAIPAREFCASCVVGLRDYPRGQRLSVCPLLFCSPCENAELRSVKCCGCCSIQGVKPFVLREVKHMKEKNIHEDAA